ncbi:MAG: hypothetical protein U9N83_07665, partial [Thermodesulfobacteriota bacterium]|nr:hypothetical protein [Thermodesulfobacteriota bacterium]
RVLSVLCRRFYNKGLMPIEIIRITRDILNIIDNRGLYNAGILNKKLERLGWEKNIVDNYIFELILYYLEYEGTYKVEVYIENPVRECTAFRKPKSNTSLKCLINANGIKESC